MKKKAVYKLTKENAQHRALQAWCKRVSKQTHLFWNSAEQGTYRRGLK